MNKPLLASKIRSAFTKSMKDVHLGDVVSSAHGDLGYYQGVSNFSDPSELKVRLVQVVQPYYGSSKSIESHFIYGKEKIPITIQYER